jgi:tRNA A-37 threonylcarbamoyl transferase component Bud32
METGEQIGDYIIVRQIGEGGMSVVYLAEHKEHGTLAVVKRLRQQLALNEQLVKYFVQGARIMHELRHPHLAAVYDYIEHGDRYFMVEEYLSGGSLADLLDKGEPISEEQALRWCRDALRAVDYANQSGIVHRDLKPGNLMLNQEREVKVTDFGIARVFGGPRLTKTGDEKGTPLYMSPEQIRTPDKVDHLSDVYSMGVVLYELLTRRVPFEGEAEFDIKQAVVLEPPVPPRQLNRSISRDAERIVLKALQKRPENRFSGCGEFAVHIDRCLASGKGPVWSPLEWIKEHRRIAAGLLLLLLAPILALGIPRIIELVRRASRGPVIAPPIIELVANPRAITSGQEATLKWKTQNADKIRIEPDIGEVPAIGSQSVAPTRSVSYLITATGPGGTESKSVLVTVIVPGPVIEITASHDVITPRHPTVLRWNVRHADKVRIEPGIGDVPSTGTRIVAPEKSVKYVVTATGVGGTAQRSVELIVAPKPTPPSGGTRTARVPIVVEPAPAPAPTLTLTAKPQVIQAGEEAVLEWEAQNAFNVRIEPDLGVFPLTGRVKVKPTKSVTYSATAPGPLGTQASATAHITVESPSRQAPTSKPRAKPDVNEARQNTSIEWEATNAGSVRIEPGIGDVAATGSLPVTLTSRLPLSRRQRDQEERQPPGSISRFSLYPPH